MTWCDRWTVVSLLRKIRDERFFLAILLTQTQTKTQTNKNKQTQATRNHNWPAVAERVSFEPKSWPLECCRVVLIHSGPFSHLSTTTTKMNSSMCFTSTPALNCRLEPSPRSSSESTALKVKQASANWMTDFDRYFRTTPSRIIKPPLAIAA